MLSPGQDGAAIRPAAQACLHLAEMNINPSSGLATDYLNHFNEAIMLLELLSEMPECKDDFLAWRPMTYPEHFSASHLTNREAAIAAYAAADPKIRERLDTLATSMTEILMATRNVMEQAVSARSLSTIAHLAACWLKPLIVRAGAVINGPAVNGNPEAAPQAAVDALMAR
jgi:hypothetical protein